MENLFIHNHQHLMGFIQRIFEHLENTKYVIRKKRLLNDVFSGKQNLKFNQIGLACQNANKCK